MNLAPATRELSWTDERLVHECCKGNQEAWAALIEKYKNLIFSIPVKFGFSREDAADIFQAVCVELLAGLPKLREPKALPKWLMQTSYHQCLRWKKLRWDLMEDTQGLESEKLPSPEELPEEILYQVQREQSVRETISALPARCIRMVTMLFFEDPPRAYDEVARELQLATGSIGFTRCRCLKKLRQLLEEKGFN
ncbi:MAG TPA: sigma-70 family RNA polymerase sigma factor [Terriglobales bacterium]|nr:sigma-70 family RNA polymerase sigma factor [Terriglobales bacterium]